jgi:anaerobic selenocysteine-containing dehydrogenase
MIITFSPRFTMRLTNVRISRSLPYFLCYFERRNQGKKKRRTRVETQKSYCRYCHAYCAIEVDVEHGKPIAIRGDVSDPVYGGYTCIKGRQLPDLYDAPDRLKTAQKKLPDGSFKAIPTSQALDEIAAKVASIIDNDGPRAIASYCGTYAFMESSALALARTFHRGIGSESFYSSVTIDQPGRPIAMSRFGMWGGGTHSFADADVVMSIGNNAVVSSFSMFGGIPPFNPYRRMNDGIRDGKKLIVIDPRKTEVARKAHLFLQVRPGEDPTLLAGIIRVILEEGLHDREFCDNYVDGLEQIRAEVDPYTLEYVSRRAAVPADQVAAAARLFAAGPKGMAVTGTGPNMAQRAPLTEHLVLTLNSICGRYNRAGERMPNPGILSPPKAFKAHVLAANPAWGNGPRSRVRDLGQIFGEMPTAALSDEILEPGEGQVKALFSIGGNPIVAWPDQLKTKRALDTLELLVCVDIRMSATAQLADYILPGKICLEREDMPALTDNWYDVPYGHYTEAVCEPNGDVLEEWEFYWELAQRLNTELPLPGGSLPTDQKPEKQTVLEHMFPNPKVAIDEIRAQQGGHVFSSVQVTVEPGDSDARLQLLPEGVAQELREVRAEAIGAHGAPARDGDFSHLLISRRLKHVYNSSGQQLPAIQKKGTTNSAYMHPEDVSALGIGDGDIVQISSRHGQILGVVAPAPDVKRGVISMAHAWGGLPGNEGEVRQTGSSTNRLLSNEQEFDPITGMARQSAIPVNVQPVAI